MEFQFNPRKTGTQFHEWVAGEASARLFVVISFHSEHNGKAAARFMDGGISGMLSNSTILLTDRNIVAAGCEC